LAEKLKKGAAER
jgi:hypothetical protein